MPRLQIDTSDDLVQFFERHLPLPSLPSLDLPSGQAILERAGWRVHRLPCRWQDGREACLAEVDALLGGGLSSAEEETMRRA